MSEVLLTTHKVIIDANDEDHAKWLEQALTNDGYRTCREIHQLIKKDNGNVILERKIVDD